MVFKKLSKASGLLENWLFASFCPEGKSKGVTTIFIP
jgi:hypothetical protein